MVSNKEIRQFILQELKVQLGDIFQKSVGPIKKRLQGVCEGLIKQRPEYAGLLGGKLLGELGVPDIKPKLEKIISTIQNSIEVAYQPLTIRGNNLQGGIIISILRSDLEDVLSLSEGSYRTEKGEEIPWLNWLLTQGDRIIVLGYDAVFTQNVVQQLRSRTGLALMRKGAGWRVPPDASGTLANNWLTRAFDFDSIEDIIFDIVEEEITRNI